MCQNWDTIWPIGQIMAKFCHTACTPWYTPGKTCIPNKNMNRYSNEDIQVTGNMKLNLLMQTILFFKNVVKIISFMTNILKWQFQEMSLYWSKGQTYFPTQNHIFS